MYLPRELEKELLQAWEEKRIFIIRGPRRSGKTTLLKHLQQIKGGTYISMESPGMLEQFLKDPIGFVKGLEDPIFLDELQYGGKQAGKALKQIYDFTDKKIIVSGSGAFDLKTNVQAYLVGRAYIYDLPPLSFREFVEWKMPQFKHLYQPFDFENPGLPPESPLLKELYEKYLKYGGYPEVVLKESKKELESIAFTTIEEDIIRYFSLRQANSMWNIVKKLAALTGNILHYSELGLSYTTIQEYLTILERSFVIRLLRPYATNPLVELKKSPKVYFYDTGFRNAILGQYEITGQTLENGVFRALLPHNPHYWRTRSKAEVDFVIIKNNKPIPIEVKSGKGRITRSLISFIKKYKPPYAIVISSQPWVTSRLDIPVYGIPPYQL